MRPGSSGMTKAGLMPPWMPGPDSAPIIGREKRRLTAAELQTLARWTAAGAPAGNAGRPPLEAFGRSRSRRPRHDDRPRAAERLRAARRGRWRSTTTTASCSIRSSSRTRSSRGADPAAAHRDRPPRDPLRGGRRAGDRGRAAERAERRQGLVVLRRAEPAASTSSARRDRPARAAAVDRRLGARAHDERAPAGTGVLLHKGAKIVMQVHYNLIAASGPTARAPCCGPPRHDAADAARDAPDRGARRAALPARRHRPAVHRAAGAPGRGRRSTAPRRRSSRRRCSPLRQDARRLSAPTSARHDDQRPRATAPFSAAADDLRRRRPHAPARPRHLGRARPRHAEAADAAPHPGLGLPLAGRLLPEHPVTRRPPATPCASRAVRQLDGRPAGRRHEAARRRATCSGARARPTRCASRCSASRRLR